MLNVAVNVEISIAISNTANVEISIAISNTANVIKYYFL